MAKLLLKNHPLITSAADIDYICKPLRKHYGITHFLYTHSFDDGSQIVLCSNPGWSRFFYEDKEYYQAGEFEKKPSQYESGYVLWSTLKNQLIFQESRNHFNIDHGITIIEKHEQSCEFFYFGTTPDNHAIINFYLNNIELLKRFILYFKDKAAPIFKEYQQQKIILPLSTHIKEQPLDPALIFTKIHDTNAFMKETCIKLFPIGDVSLTRREIECALHLIEGKTARDIGHILHLSPRTIEGHIEHIKNKTQCRNKSELITLFRKQHFVTDAGLLAK